MERDTTDDPSQEQTTQRPEGMSPERWRRSTRRANTVETAMDIGSDMSEIKLFIKQQIGEAIAEIKMNNKYDKTDINNRSINKPKIVSIKRLDKRVRMDKNLISTEKENEKMDTYDGSDSGRLEEARSHGLRLLQRRRNHRGPKHRGGWMSLEGV